MSISASVKEPLFIIGASTGVISLNGTLDREFRQEYRLRVLVSQAIYQFFYRHGFTNSTCPQVASGILGGSCLKKVGRQVYKFSVSY